MARSNAFAPAFAALMLGMGEAFHEPVSDTRIDLYAEALADLPERDVLLAMKACIAQCKFFPRPAEIRERVSGPEADRAELAWSHVLTAVQRVGAYGWPSALTESEIGAVRATWGSWQRLCETLPADGPELLGWRKAFVAQYGAGERAEARDPRSRDLPAAVRAALQDVSAQKVLR